MVVNNVATVLGKSGILSAKGESRAAGRADGCRFRTHRTHLLSERAKYRLAIVGVGFGGVFAAKHLRRRAGGDVRIQLISRKNFFVFQPLLPGVAGGNIHPSEAGRRLCRDLDKEVSGFLAQARNTANRGGRDLR